MAKKSNYKKGHKSQDRALQHTGVYLMCNVPLIFICKFGITDYKKERTKNVSETTAGAVFRLVYFRLPFGYQFEQFIHRLYAFQNFTLSKGSGKTEWFLNFSPVVGSLIIFYASYFNSWMSVTAHALSFFPPVVWLDGLFWLIAFRISSLLAGIAIFLFVIYFFAHLK